MATLFLQEDPLTGLSQADTFTARLQLVHAELRRRCPGVERMAIALHDRSTGLLKTYAASPAQESPLRNYEARLEQAASLHDTFLHHGPRVVDDLSAFAGGAQRHTRIILGHGFASSYTLPIFDCAELLGFVFCNAMQKNYFRNGVLDQVSVFAQLTAQLVINDTALLRTMTAALRTAIGMVHHHDPETGNHLERMARYARLIACELVERGECDYDDEQVEQLFNFTPLHDVGKLGIPDSILRKPGKLDPGERRVMDTHPVIGRQMIDALIDNFGLAHIPYVMKLRDLVEFHHEALDGSGYPHGLRGAQVPLEARITTVSDVFDALTTLRAYKNPWPNTHAYALLQLMAIDKLDRRCVAALLARPDAVEQIQAQFADRPEPS